MNYARAKRGRTFHILDGEPHVATDGAKFGSGHCAKSQDIEIAEVTDKPPTNAVCLDCRREIREVEATAREQIAPLVAVFGKEGP